MRPAAALQSGDLVDLAKLGPYGFDRANPDSESWRIAADCEYGVVDEVDRETDTCVLVHFENFPSFGLPPDFLVTLGVRAA